MIKKILLIHPPKTFPIGEQFCNIQEPLGILYIAASLRDYGYDVSVIDLRAVDRLSVRGKFRTYGADPDDIRGILKKFKPDLIGVSCPTMANEYDLFKTCKIAKSVHRNIPIVVGGVHPTILPERMLSQPYIDYVIMGEGEFRLRYLIEALNSRPAVFQFDGIAYRKSGKTVINKCTSVIEDIDSLPFPARDLVDMKSYAYINNKYNKHHPPLLIGGQVEATRGCFNSCTYCAVSKFEGRRIRFRSIKKIIAEINWLKKNYGIEEVNFVQNNMAVNKKYILDLCRELETLNIRSSVIAGLWPNVLDHEIISAMAKAGFSSICLAISSASKRVLIEIMHRPVNIERIPELVKECRQQGMQVTASFVLGMIGETRSELLQSLNYPIKLGLDGAEFLVGFPLPGTDFYDYAKEKGYLPRKLDYRRAFFCHTSILTIPKNSPDFVLSPQELNELIEQKQMQLKIQLRKRLEDRKNLKNGISRKRP